MFYGALNTINYFSSVYATEQQCFNRAKRILFCFINASRDMAIKSKVNKDPGATCRTDLGSGFIMSKPEDKRRILFFNFGNLTSTVHSNLIYFPDHCYLYDE